MLPINSRLLKRYHFLLMENLRRIRPKQKAGRAKFGVRWGGLTLKHLAQDDGIPMLTSTITIRIGVYI